MTATVSSPTTTVKVVRFAEAEVSAVFEVAKKTQLEAFSLFYQPADVDRFRAEARWEKLAADATALTKCSEEKLNAMSKVARNQFENTCRRSHFRSTAAKGCARIA